MKIAMIASECVPFAKTGGLADVVGALPKALSALGHEVIIIMPKYSKIDKEKHSIDHTLSPMGVWMGDREEWCAVYETKLLSSVPVYLIEYEHYFDREGLYNGKGNHEYPDNAKRFSFLSRAALQLCKDIDFVPDIIHAHDWQAALALAYLKLWHWNDPHLGETAGVLTIHNMGYQGKSAVEHFEYTGLKWENFTPDKFEDHGKINFLKGGIYFADMVNTVSPTYAEETKAPHLGYGLAPYLNNKDDRYIGILNGIDYTIWNPETDKLIPANYSHTDTKGKLLCKKTLQEVFHLDIDSNIPIIGIVSRFAEQKGLNLLAEVIENIIESMHVQFVILGSGDKSLEKFFQSLPEKHKGKIGSHIGYNDDLSHIVEAGSDFFLMPSIYEPCGLNQIYSLKYGTLPIVRATGGLEDTVEQYDEFTGKGTGFKFHEPSPLAVYHTIGWAVSTFFDRKEHFYKMRREAMKRHFSWDDSANQYVKLYHRAIHIRRKQKQPRF